MRPISESQEPQRNILNSVLGTQAQVRILRFLTDADISASVRRISENTGISVPGVHKALSSLVKTGLVSKDGSGHSFQYSLGRRSSLADAIVSLFAFERQRYDELLGRVRAALGESSPAPRSAWIEGGQDRIGAPLVLGVLHGPGELGPYLRELRLAVSPIERDFELTIEFAGYTRADLADRVPTVERLLSGIPPLPVPNDPSTPAAGGSPESRDARLQLRADIVSTMVEEDPTLIVRAGRWLDRQLEAGHGTADADLRAWRVLLDSYPRHRLAEFLRSGTPRAVRLSRSSPLLPVLSDKQRRELETAR